MEYRSFKGDLPSWGETESGDRIRSREVNGRLWLIPRAVVTTGPARRERTVGYRGKDALLCTPSTRHLSGQHLATTGESHLDVRAA